MFFLKLHLALIAAALIFLIVDIIVTLSKYGD